MLLPTCSLFLLSTLFLSSTSARSVVVEKRNAPPRQWKRSLSSPHPETIIPLQIGLTQQNLDKVHDELLRVSHPTSKSYGKHWTPAAIKDFFSPLPSTVSAVKNWLDSAGLDSDSRAKLSDSGTWLLIDVTVEEAENLLATRYDVYERFGAEGGKEMERVACNSYSVPESVRHHIDIITPTVHFDVPHNLPKASAAKSNKRVAPRSASPGSIGTAKNSGPKFAPVGFSQAYEAVAAAGQLGNCSAITTLGCLAALYNYGNYTQVATAKNSYAVVEYSPNSYAPQDLDMFFGVYAPEQVGDRPVTYDIDFGLVTPVPTNFEVNGESDLDLEYAMGIVYPLIPVLYQMGPGTSLSNFLEALDSSYCAGDDPTQDGVYSKLPGGCGGTPLSSVISTSYAYDEAALTPAYEIRQCNEYGKLGMMGTTFMFSSGDTGVAGSGGCLDSNGQPPSENETGDGGIGFSPSYPSTCPFVLSIGATQTKLNADVTQPNAEEACEQVIFSGGGFSNVFGIPDYQTDALAYYFKNYLPPYNSSQYNTTQTSRGIPDISANGANYAVAYSGMMGLVYGTSASSPVIGAIITLINDARLAVGKSTVGFINPAIYMDSFAEGFNEITSGTNPGCGTVGFSAVPKWNPVTGLGTPNFQKLKDLFLALP